MSKKKLDPAEMTAEEAYEQGMRSYRGHRYAKAVTFLEVAESKGSRWATRQLAFMKMKGQGMERNISVGYKKLLALAKELQHAESYVEVADFLCQQTYPFLTFDEILELYDKAIALGSITALREKGLTLLATLGHPSEEALDCLNKASEAGDSQASLDLAMTYLHNLFFETSGDLAVKYFIRAYEQGEKDVAVKLGYTYLYMLEPNKKNLDQAIHWLKIAAKEGDVDAIQTLMTLEK